MIMMDMEKIRSFCVRLNLCRMDIIVITIIMTLTTSVEKKKRKKENRKIWGILFKK